MGENQGNVCSFCEEESPDLLKCSRCKEVYYCSRDCQRGHWREGHREDCKDETASSGDKFLKAYSCIHMRVLGILKLK